MTARPHSSLFFVLLGALALAGCGASDDAELGPGDAEEETADLEDGVAEDDRDRPDAAAAAKAVGVSAEEMLAMAPVMEAFGDYVGALRDAIPERVAAARIVYHPALALQLAFVGEAPPEATTLRPKSLSSANIELVSGAPYSEVELQARARKVHAALRAQGYTAIRTGTDGFRGVVQARVAPVPGASAKLAGIGAAKAVADAEGDTEVSLASPGDFSAQAGLRGGTKLDPGCTSAFSVKRDGERGLATAGHCSPTQYGGPGPAWPLISSTKHQGSLGDMRVYRTAGTELPSFYSGDGAGPRPVKKVRATNSIITGEAMCFNGRVNQYECARVADPSMSCDFPDDSAGTIGLLVEMEEVVTASGDSGGPWFLGSEAIGIHTGRCGGSVFSKVGHLKAATGWSVLIKPD